MKRQSGFTLIELLVATVLMLSMVTIASLGFDWFSQQWTRRLSTIEQSYQNYIQQQQFETAISGIVPYMVNKGDDFGYYFLGRKEGFTAVSLTPIFEADHPAVIRVFSEQTTNGYQLVYEEASLKELILISSDQILPFKHRLIVTGGAAQIAFKYLIENHIITGNEELPDGIKSQTSFDWKEELDGISTKKHATKIEVVQDDYSFKVMIPKRDQVLNSRTTLDAI